MDNHNNSTNYTHTTNNPHSQQQQQDDKQEEMYNVDILASASALMGENVIDSPTTRHYKTRLYYIQHQSSLVVEDDVAIEQQQQQQQQQQQLPSVPNIEKEAKQTNSMCNEHADAATNSNERITTSNSSIATKSTTQAQQHPSSSSAATTATKTSPSQSNTTNATTTATTTTTTTAAGIVAQGLAWARQQRYHRQRSYLKHQAEQQLRKIQEATAKQQQRDDDANDNNDEEDTNINNKVNQQQQQQQDFTHKNSTTGSSNTSSSTGSSLQSLFGTAPFQSWIRLAMPAKPVTMHRDMSRSEKSGSSNEDNDDNFENRSNNHHSSTIHSYNDEMYDDNNDENDYYNNKNHFWSISKSGLGVSVELPKLVNTTVSGASTNNTSDINKQCDRNGTNNSKCNDDDDNGDGHDDDDDDETSWIPQVRVEDDTIYNDNQSNIHGNPSMDENDACCQNDFAAATTKTKTTSIDGKVTLSPTTTIPKQQQVYPPYLLSPDEMYQIAVHVLPRNIAYCKWKRYYSLVRDGDSFDNCIRQVQHCRQSLLVIRTTKNERFGTYVDAPWDNNSSLQHGSVRYYGGPETCLFKLVSTAAAATSNGNEADTPLVTKLDPNTASPPSSTNHPTKVLCYKWSGMNRYIQLCDIHNKMMAIGGGNDTFGLCIQQDFQYGTTGTCTTFNNEPLCSEEQFHILDVEIYGFLLGQF